MDGRWLDPINAETTHSAVDDTPLPAATPSPAIPEAVEGAKAAPDLTFEAGLWLHADGDEHTFPECINPAHFDPPVIPEDSRLREAAQEYLAWLHRKSKVKTEHVICWVKASALRAALRVDSPETER